MVYAGSQKLSFKSFSFKSFQEMGLVPNAQLAAQRVLSATLPRATLVHSIARKRGRRRLNSAAGWEEESIFKLKL